MKPAHQTAPQETEIQDELAEIKLAMADLSRQNVSLEEQIRKLQQASEYRSGFLSLLTHELRTPLTSILGFSEIMLTHEALSDAQRSFCERIQNSARQLQGSVNQLADISRLEIGQSERYLEEFSLAELLRDACLALTRHAQKQKAEVRCQPGPESSRMVSDRGKLRQVVFSFLAHAISRSPGTVVTVSSEDGPIGCLLSITDEGTAPVDETAFVEFDPLKWQAGGGELGLAIARQNVDFLGGSLSLESRVPHGLQVLIRLPMQPGDSWPVKES